MAERVHDYHDGNRYWQGRIDTRRLADRSAGRLREHIDATAQEVIEGADMFFLATCDHRGLPTCSYKGGDPGFVCGLGLQVADELVNVTVAGTNGAEIDDLGVVVFGHISDGNGRFMHIHSDVQRARLGHG